MQIAHDDPRISWPGSVSLERTDTYTRPWRLPFDSIERFYPALQEKGASASGVRIDLISSSTKIAGKFLPISTERPKMDLFIDGEFHSSVDLTGQTEFVFENLSSAEKRIELWLPQFAMFSLESLVLDEGASLKKVEDSRPKWITYGSSITHCRGAESPSLTWPSIAARTLGLNLTSMGFGGECHLDIAIARTIRDSEADIISICSGINIQGRCSLNERSFPSNLMGSVDIIREKHPEIPILLISPIFACHRETQQNAVGWNLQDYRNAVQETAAKLRDLGDQQIYYLSGLDLFDESLVEFLPDQLHPNAEGYQIMGKNFVEFAQRSPEIFPSV
tara:strand:- start:11580 stop:12581 length:1002 start_codon:yes stop_codon:yes gene_type:complete